MKQLLGNLIAVLVPDEYNKFKISDTNYLCGAEENAYQALPPRLDEGFYKIIGTIDVLGKFDFDCEKHVWKNPKSNKYHNYDEPYSNSWGVGKFETKEESFISLLNREGIFIDKNDNQKILIIEKI